MNALWLVGLLPCCPPRPRTRSRPRARPHPPTSGGRVSRGSSTTCASSSASRRRTRRRSSSGSSTTSGIPRRRTRTASGPRHHRPGRARVPLLPGVHRRRAGERPGERDVLRHRQGRRAASRSPRRASTTTTPKDVPHGEVRERWYFSKTTAGWRRIFVYTPPGYDADRETRYPVLYLQHGGGEDETGWPNQGRMSFILDNLIAEKKAEADDRRDGAGLRPRPGEPAVPTAPPRRPSRARTRRAGLQPDVQRVRGRDDQGPDPDDRRDLPHDPRPRAPRDGRASRWAACRRSRSRSKHLDLFSSIGGFSGAGGGFGGAVRPEDGPRRRHGRRRRVQQEGAASSGSASARPSRSGCTRA